MTLELTERQSVTALSLTHGFYIFAVPSKYFVHLLVDELLNCLCLINYSITNRLFVLCV